MSEIFLTIINMSISASWLVLAVLFLRLVLKKAPKWVNVLLWGFVAFRLVCPVSFESVLSLIPSAETISPQIMMDPTPQISTGISALNGVINPLISGSLTPAPGDSANPLQIWIPLVTAVWVVGIALMLIYTAVSYFLLRRKVDTAIRLRNNIFQSENVDSPFVLGIMKPTIYLPFQMDSGNLEYVIAHEEAHIRRKDHWWKPFGFMLLAVHWFNPLMWVGYILLCRDIELACDEKVIKELGNQQRADYSQALVDCSINRRSIAACPLAFGEVGVKERVKSVMNYKKPGFWVMVAAIITCIVVAVCFLTNPVDQISLSKLNKDQANMPGILNDVTGVVVTYEGVSVSCSEKAEVNRFLTTLEKINVSKEPISKNRSEDRSKAFTIKVNGNTDLYFNEDFTEFWVYDYVKPSLTHRITNPETAKELISDFNFTASQPAGTAYEFHAKVIEVHDRYLVVDPEEGSVERTSADRIEISLENKTSWPIPRVGDEVMVVYDGQLLETYPARITNVYRIEIMNYDSGPVETIRGNMKTYYKNSDGTWQVDGRIYKYRLEISGQVENPACPGPTTFVYLSNLENITFKEAWNALFSGNCADWFLVHEAVLVDWPSGNVTYAGNENDPLVTNPEPAEYSFLIDSIIYDIDGNGKNEICTLIYGPTSGLFSFCLNASPVEAAAGTKYSETYVLMDAYQLSFDLAEDGILRIKGESVDESKEVVFFDIAVKDGRIVLQCADEELLFDICY